MISLLSQSSRRCFLGQLTGAALALTRVKGLGAPATPPSGVPADRLSRLATGANVCLWFRYADGRSKQHFESYLPDEEAAMMAGLGIKHVRLCVHPQVIMDTTTGELLPERMDFLEAAIRRFHRHGLLVMVDLHNEEHDKESGQNWQDAILHFWERFSRRLSGLDPELTMLEMLNEPVFWDHPGQWEILQRKIVTVIRKEAPRHTILASGARWGGIDGLKLLKPLDDRNIVYSFHCYDPMLFTHQGATWASDEMRPLRAVPYPSSPEAVSPLLSTLQEHPSSRDLVRTYGEQRWNRAKLSARFQEAVDWGKTHQVPLYCGEFGVYPRHAKPEHRAEWFRDFGGILSGHSIGWSVWGWDEGFGLNRRRRDGKITVDPVVARALGFKFQP